MADNNELRADIKINVESNADEAVAKAEKAFDSLNNKVNSQNSGGSFHNDSIDTLLNDINNIEIPDGINEQINDIANQFTFIDEILSKYTNADLGDNMIIAGFDQGAIGSADDLINKVESLNTELSAVGDQFKFIEDILNNYTEQYSTIKFDFDTSAVDESFGLMNQDLVLFEEKIPPIVEEFGLATKPAKEIKDSLEISSKYAMDISNMKVPEGVSNWFDADDNKEGASYNFQIPEMTEKTSELKKESSGLASVLGGELSGAFGKLLPTLGAGALLVSGFKHALSETKEALNDIINISKRLGTAFVDAFKTILNTIDRLIDKCVQLGKKLQSLAEEGVTLQQKWFTAYNYLGAQAGTDVRNFLGNMEELYGLDADNLVGSLREISSLVGNVGLDAENSSKAVKALVTQSVDMAAFSGYDYDSIVSNMQSAVNMGYIGRSSPLIRALGLTKDDVEQFKKLNTEAERLNFILSKGTYVRGSYEKWLNTTAGRVTTLNNATSRLRGNTGRLAMVLWARVAPVLTKLVNLVNELVDGLAKLLDLDLTGAEANLADTSMIFDGLGSSTADVSSGINNVADNLNKAADSADEAKKHLASFDDVIQIPEDTSSDIADELGGLDDLGGVDELAGTLGNFDFAGLADDIKKTNGALSEFFKLLKEGRYDEAGSWLNNFLQEKLDSIPWNDIKDKVGMAANRLALFLNGLFSDPELFRKIGKTIAEGINTAIIAVRNFAGNLNWASVGKALSQSWKGFWEGFDSKALGQALFNVIHGAFVAFWSFVEDMWKVDEETGANGWVIAGYKIADVLNTFFSSWTMEDVEHAAQSIIDFINGVFQMLAAFLKTLDMEDIKEKFRAFIHKMFTGFKDNAGEWGKTLGELIGFIVDMLEILIEEWDSTGMTGAILDFLENSRISELVAEWMKIKFRIWLTTLLAEILVGGEAILKNISDFGGKIGDFLAKIPEKIISIGLNIINFILDWVVGISGIILGGAVQLGVDISNWLGGIGTWIGEHIYDVVHWVIDGIAEIGGSIWDGIVGIEGSLENFGGFIYDKVQDVKNGIINTWNEFWDTWKIGADTISGIWDGICEGIKNVFQGVVKFITDGIETICNGITGLVDKIHDIPVIGTGMDKLADFTGGIINKIDIPFLASGGIVDRATPAVIGEAGREAVIPLENNTSWMDSFANKLSQRMGGTTQGVPQTVVIDMSKSVKPVYSRSEMVAFGRQVAEALKVYGVQVSVNT